MTDGLTRWLLQSDEPWACYRTLVDLLDRPEDDPEVQAARADMLAHPKVQELVAQATAWPGYLLKRHNDARHPIYKWSTLADFGVRADDPGMGEGVAAVMAHQSPWLTFLVLRVQRRIAHAEVPYAKRWPDTRSTDPLLRR